MGSFGALLSWWFIVFQSQAARVCAGDAEAQLASQVGGRGDEFVLKPLRVEEAGAIPRCGMLVVT